MTRRAPAELFASDPETAVLAILERAEMALTALDIKRELVDGGVEESAIGRAWPNLQKRLRSHDNVEFEGRRYRWQAGLPTDPTQSIVDTYDVEVPWVRALAELAMELEELAHNGASSEAVTHRIRSRVTQVGLEPIDRAGDRVPFDRQRHEPVGRAIEDDVPVVVIRPGYVWRAATGDVLIAPAVVQDRG